MRALGWSRGASGVGSPHFFLFLSPLKHICLLFLSPTSLGISFSAATLTFSEAEILSPTSVPPPSSSPRDLSLLLLPGDGGLSGADRAPVCAQPSKRTAGTSKHFTEGAKP